MVFLLVAAEGMFIAWDRGGRSEREKATTEKLEALRDELAEERRQHSLTRTYVIHLREVQLQAGMRPQAPPPEMTEDR